MSSRLSFVGRLVPLVVALALVPSVASATTTTLAWWRHGGSADACLEAAQAAFIVSGLTGVTRNDAYGFVGGTAGEYSVTAVCIDSTATLAVAGPDDAGAHALYDRVFGNWR